MLKEEEEGGGGGEKKCALIDHRRWLSPMVKMNEKWGKIQFPTLIGI